MSNSTNKYEDVWASELEDFVLVKSAPGEDRPYAIIHKTSGLRLKITEEQVYATFVSRMLENGTPVFDKYLAPEVHPLPENAINLFKGLWQGGRFSRYALVKVDVKLGALETSLPYSIFDVWRQAMFLIEDNAMAIAVTQKMLRSGVPVFNDHPTRVQWLVRCLFGQPVF